MTGLILATLMVGLNWNEVFLREPIAKASAPDLKPSPAPKAEGCGCDTCKDCKCKDGLHTKACLSGGFREASPEKTAEKTAEKASLPRLRGGSGATYEHADPAYLASWIAANDPPRFANPCPPGTACRAR